MIERGLCLLFPDLHVSVTSILCALERSKLRQSNVGTGYGRYCDFHSVWRPSEEKLRNFQYNLPPAIKMEMSLEKFAAKNIKSNIDENLPPVGWRESTCSGYWISYNVTLNFDTLPVRWVPSLIQKASRNTLLNSGVPKFRHEWIIKTHYYTSKNKHQIN